MQLTLVYKHRCVLYRCANKETALLYQYHIILQSINIISYNVLVFKFMFMDDKPPSNKPQPLHERTTTTNLLELLFRNVPKTVILAKNDHFFAQIMPFVRGKNRHSVSVFKNFNTNIHFYIAIFRYLCFWPCTEIIFQEKQGRIFKNLFRCKRFALKKHLINMIFGSKKLSP